MNKLDQLRWVILVGMDELGQGPVSVESAAPDGTAITIKTSDDQEEGKRCRDHMNGQR